MKETVKPIVAATCEDIAAPRYPLTPLMPSEGSPLRFLVQDPFGLRRAIVPVFLSVGGDLIGAGTAFHADRFGTLVTADHVISDMRQGLDFGRFEANIGKNFDAPLGAPRPLIWLGGICVFGHAPLPDGMLVSVKSVFTTVARCDNPIRAISGRSDSEIAADVAALKIEPVRDKEWIATLPIRLSGWRPKMGDTVLAVGFPEIESRAINRSSLQRLLSEGMYAGYGKIIAAHPNGRDRSNPTPVIEV